MQSSLTVFFVQFFCMFVYCLFYCFFLSKKSYKYEVSLRHKRTPCCQKMSRPRVQGHVPD